MLNFAATCSLCSTRSSNIKTFRHLNAKKTSQKTHQIDTSIVPIKSCLCSKDFGTSCATIHFKCNGTKTVLKNKEDSRNNQNHRQEDKNVNLVLKWNRTMDMMI